MTQTQFVIINDRRYSFFFLFFSDGEEVVGLVGVITVGMEGEGEATGEEAATEVEADTITVGLPAMVPVTGGIECGGRGCTYMVICKNSHIVIIELQ